MNTLRQAYFCVLDNYHSGPVMDPKESLQSAFAAYTQNLMRRGADRRHLQLPALTGNRDTDRAAFAKVLGAGDPAALRAAITGMVAGRYDNHARWVRPDPSHEGGPTGTGIAGVSAEYSRTVELKEGPITRQPPAVTSKLADGVTYVQLPGFYKGAADQVIAKLRDKSKVVVLDLRGNGGGSSREVTRLLGAFAHGEIASYFCPLKGECVPNRTDDSVPLLGSRLVVLTDRGCASACEDFSAAVKDNGLGALVGTRTAWAVSGPSEAYLLDDGSAVFLPRVRHLGPAREIIDTIGVPVDHYAPMTALDLATGRDPGVAKALALV